MSEKHTFRSVWEAAESSIKGMNPETDCLGSNPCFFYFLLAVWPWTDCLTSLCFSFLISKIRIMILIAYGEWYWIPGLQRREFCFGTKDIASVTQSFVHQKFYYSEKGTEKASLQTSEGGRECPPHEFGWSFIYFSNCVKVDQSCRTLCDPMIYTVHGILQARTLE